MNAATVPESEHAPVGSFGNGSVAIIVSYSIGGEAL